ncbi:MAG TPA: IS110 family transposase [Chloroflexota bacterium]|nr:IS110 family transposase [Chloroflexota bacterium]
MAMNTMPRGITAGVDTHLDVHVAAALDPIGGLLGVESFATTPAGYRALLEWLRSFGEVTLAGVDGTGSYGAGLTRLLLSEGVAVVEVDRPNRQVRRRRGKSDPQDAISAARAALSGEADGLPKSRDGAVEAIRTLRLVRSSARKERTRALNQMRSLVSTAPDDLRGELRDLTIFRLVERAAGYRPTDRRSVVGATKFALRMLARRVRSLDAEIAQLDAELQPLVADTAPDLVAQIGVGTDSAGALLVAAGDNPQRLRSEASFAHLCAASPIDASSGKQQRHRVNTGGDRQANAALWRIVLVRLSHDPTTTAYLERRVKEGLTKREAIRCLKRYVARDLYRHLPREKVACMN